MEKFIPYEKMSKKKQREIDRKKRASWNGLDPVTRKGKNLKVYNRKKVLKWNDDSFQGLLFCSFLRGQGETVRKIHRPDGGRFLQNKNLT